MGLLPNGSLIDSDAFETDAGDRLLEVRAGGVSRFLGAQTSDPAMPEIDGSASQARCCAPAGLSSAGDGTVFIMPKHARHPVRKFDPQAETVTSWVY